MKKLFAPLLLLLFAASVQAQPYVHPFDFRMGDALTLQNVYQDVDASGRATARVWTTEVVHFSVYDPVGTLTFTKNSTDDPTIVVLTDGFYAIKIPAADSDLTGLDADSTYWYEIDEVDTDGFRHTRIMGHMYTISRGNFPIAGVTSGVGVLLGTAGVNFTLQTAGPGNKGIPAGGSSGQVLTKNSGNDYDATWSSAAGVADGSVTNAKLDDMAQATIKGRASGAGTGVPTDLTAAQARTILNVEDGADVTDATNVDAAGATMNTDTDVSGTSWVVDEDNMSSDSNTKVPTQQSVKAYVDASGGTDDQTAAEVTSTPTGGIAATDVDAAIAELEAEKAPKASTVATKAALIAYSSPVTDQTFFLTQDGQTYSVETYDANDARLGIEAFQSTDDPTKMFVAQRRKGEGIVLSEAMGFTFGKGQNDTVADTNCDLFRSVMLYAPTVGEKVILPSNRHLDAWCDTNTYLDTWADTSMTLVIQPEAVLKAVSENPRHRQVLFYTPTRSNAEADTSEAMVITVEGGGTLAGADVTGYTYNQDNTAILDLCTNPATSYCNNTFFQYDMRKGGVVIDDVTMTGAITSGISVGPGDSVYVRVKGRTRRVELRGERTAVGMGDGGAIRFPYGYALYLDNVNITNDNWFYFTGRYHHIYASNMTEVYMNDVIIAERDDGGARDYAATLNFGNQGSYFATRRLPFILENVTATSASFAIIGEGYDVRISNSNFDTDQFAQSYSRMAIRGATFKALTPGSANLAALLTPTAGSLAALDDDRNTVTVSNTHLHDTPLNANVDSMQVYVSNSTYYRTTDSGAFTVQDSTASLSLDKVRIISTGVSGTNAAINCLDGSVDIDAHIEGGTYSTYAVRMASSCDKLTISGLYASDATGVLLGLDVGYDADAVIVSGAIDYDGMTGSLPADTYAADWDADQNFAPKDAIYDKIETLDAARTTLDTDYGAETITSDFDFGGGTLQVPNSTSLPGTCEIGDSYMDTDATSGQRWYLCEAANTWAVQGSGGGSGAFSDASDPVVLNTTTKDVRIGSDVTGLTGKLEIGADADQPQLIIQADATQTDDVVIMRNSAGTEMYNLRKDGRLAIAYTGNLNQPALCLGLACTNGIHKEAGDVVGITTAGAGRLQVTSAGLILLSTSILQIGTSAGTTAASPGIRHQTYSTTGPFWASDGLGISVVGTQRLKVTASGATVTGAVTVTDDAYAVGWNGSTAVPTKNAVYDKIETLGGGGDVTGPASSTDNAITRFDGTGGKTIQNSTAATVDDSGNISVLGLTVTGLDCTGNTNGGALTANGSGVVSCSDDDGGAGGGGDNVSVEEGGSSTAASDPVFADSTQIAFGLNTTPTYDRIFATIVAGQVGTTEIGTDGVSADELNATGVEAELEAVMDLEDMQGAVTDAQVPDNITISLAATATALAANGGNCSAASYALGVDASGAAEGCTAFATTFGTEFALRDLDDLADGTTYTRVTDSEVTKLAGVAAGSDAVVVEEAGTRTETTGSTFADSTQINFELNATPTYDRIFATIVDGSVTNANLANSSVSYGGVSVSLGSSDATPAFNLADATGYLVASLSGTLANLNTALGSSIADGAHTTDTGPSPDCSGTTTYQDGEGNCDDISSVYSATAHTHTTTTVSGLDVSDDLNLTAGRSLTLTGDDVAADAELYTDGETFYIEDPVTDEDLTTVWVAPNAVTVTDISCEIDTGTSVAVDFAIDDGSPQTVNGSEISCTTTFATDSSFAGDTTLAAGDRLDINIGTVTGTVGKLAIFIKYTIDD